jgi:zinc and cadmium transporter
MVLYILLSVALVSIVSFIGVLSLALSERWLKRIAFALVSVAAGTLLGDAFLHLLPESIEQGESIWLLVIAGIGIFFILEKLIHWHHCHIPESSAHPHSIGTMNIFGDGLHNFFDGILIAGSFIVDPSLGIATTIAVILHEIPQEIADFGVLIHSGYSKAKALLMNFFSALAAVAGALTVLIFGDASEIFSEKLLPITAGAFIYIAVSDLLPELRKESRLSHSIGHIFLIALGVAFMYALKMIFE